MWKCVWAAFHETDAIPDLLEFGSKVAAQGTTSDPHTPSFTESTGVVRVPHSTVDPWGSVAEFLPSTTRSSGLCRRTAKSTAQPPEAPLDR